MNTRRGAIVLGAAIVGLGALAWVGWDALSLESTRVRIGDPAIETTTSSAAIASNLPAASADASDAEARAGGNSTARALEPEIKAEGPQRRSKGELGEPLTIRGRVVSASTGAPIESAEVACDGRFQHPARTDEDGRYELVLPPEQTAFFELRIEARASAFGRREQIFDLVHGTEVEADFELMDARRAHGRICDGDGNAIEDAEVTAVSSIDGSVGWMNDEVETRSRADGTFELLDLRPDLQHVVRIRKAGFATRIRPFPSDEKAWPDVELGRVVLAPERTLDVQVVDGAEQVVTGSRLTLSPASVESQSGSGLPAYRGRSLWISDATTDRSGRARFDRLQPGDFVMYASLPEGRQGERIPVVVPAEGPAPTVTVRLAGHSIGGRVIDAEGRPVADAHVLAALDERFIAGTQTAANGDFRLRGLAEGEYRVRATRKEWFERSSDPAESEAIVETGRDDVLLRVQPPASELLEGIVRNAAGAPVGLARVYVEVHGSPVLGVPTRIGGRFSVPIPKGATVRLHAGPSTWFPQLTDGEQLGPDAVSADASRLVELLFSDRE